jgi:gluconolactonase
MLKLPLLHLIFVAAPFVVLAALVQCHGQSKGNFPTIGSVVRQDARFDSLVAADAKVEVLASGFDWSEGPVWIKDGGYLLFSDVPRNEVLRWKEGEGLSVFLKPSGYTGLGPYSREPGSNGLTLDPQGRLVSCEHGDRRVSVMAWGSGKRTLADNYMGKRLNSPNDVVFRSNGDMYFTDPPYGLPKQENDPTRELDVFGVYRLSTDGKLTLLTGEMTRPNGIAFSPDEKTLYVAQSDPQRAVIMAFPVRADGNVDAGRVFFDATPFAGKLKGLPDGLKVDQNGNLFATGPGGVNVIAPDGTLLGRIDTGEATANCAWGDDGSVLYITADMYLCRVRTRTKGAGW